MPVSPESTEVAVVEPEVAPDSDVESDAEAEVEVEAEEVVDIDVAVVDAMLESDSPEDASPSSVDPPPLHALTATIEIKPIHRK